MYLIHKYKDSVCADFFESPIGILHIEACKLGICAITFVDKMPCLLPQKSNEYIDICKQQLSEYFFGDRNTFSVPIYMHGTEFQKKVWETSTSILYGTTKTYGELAREIKNPKSAIAVGQALAKNPILIIIPCHRILHASTNKSGYAAGIARKKWLLQFEKANKM